MQNTNFDCHWTWPPTAASSQVKTLLYCQPLVTSTRLPVAAESWSCWVTEQPSMLSLPLTFLPRLVATAGLFEEVTLLFLSFEMRGRNANGFLVPWKRRLKAHQRLQGAFAHKFHLLISNWSPCSVSGVLLTCWRSILKRREIKSQGLLQNILWVCKWSLEDSKWHLSK